MPQCPGRETVNGTPGNSELEKYLFLPRPVSACHGESMRFRRKFQQPLSLKKQHGKPGLPVLHDYLRMQ